MIFGIVQYTNKHYKSVRKKIQNNVHSIRYTDYTFTQLHVIRFEKHSTMRLIYFHCTFHLFSCLLSLNICFFIISNLSEVFVDQVSCYGVKCRIDNFTQTNQCVISVLPTVAFRLTPDSLNGVKFTVELQKYHFVAFINEKLLDKCLLCPEIIMERKNNLHVICFH